MPKHMHVETIITTRLAVVAADGSEREQRLEQRVFCLTREALERTYEQIVAAVAQLDSDAEPEA